MIDENIVNQTQRFKDLNRCLYFAEKLTEQPNIPLKEGKTGKILAYCKPVPKRM